MGWSNQAGTGIKCYIIPTPGITIQNLADHSVNMKQNERIVIISWVDDLIIVVDKVISLSNVHKMLMSEFKMKDLEELNRFKGIDFDITQKCVKMNQKRYIGRVLERFDKSNCKPRTIPCEQRMVLSNTSDPVDSRKYREIVGSLIYLMTCTRPDELSCRKIIAASIRTASTVGCG